MTPYGCKASSDGCNNDLWMGLLTFDSVTTKEFEPAFYYNEDEDETNGFEYNIRTTFYSNETDPSQFDDPATRRSRRFFLELDQWHTVSITSTKHSHEPVSTALKKSKNYRSDIIHNITHSNPSPFQSYTLPILHSSNPTLFQSYTLPILHPSILTLNLILFQP